MDIYHYLSPLIVPVLPKEAGKTVTLLNIANTLADIAVDKDDARIAFHVQVFQAGEKTFEERFDVMVAAGKPDLVQFERSYLGDKLGYVEISITADRPYFRKLFTEHVHTFIERPDGGLFNVTTMLKFSDPAIIDLMRRIGQFCLVHSAQYVSKMRNAGNSTMIVNPFDGPIVVRLTTAAGREVRRRILPREAIMISLDELIDDDRLTCVMFSGSNRYPAWDVRHAFGDQNRINRIDHLEYYRGELTVRPVTTGNFLRSRARRALRAVGLRL